MQGLVVSKTLEGRLGLGEGFKLDKDGVQHLAVPGLLFCLHPVDFGDELFELVAAPVDGVHFLANEHLQAMGWAVLLVEPACCIRTLLGGSGSTLLLRLETLSIGGLDERGLGALELVSGLVAPVDLVFQILAVTCKPNATNAFAQHGLERSSVHVLFGAEILSVSGHVDRVRKERLHRAVEDCAGREALGVERGQQVCLTDVDVVDGLARNHDQNEAEEEDCAARIGPEPPFILDVGHGEDVELGQAIAARGVDGEEDGPSDDTADDAGDDGHLEEAKEEEAIERVVVEDVGVGDGVELFDPAEEAARDPGRAILRIDGAYERSRAVAMIVNLVSSRSGRYGGRYCRSTYMRANLTRKHKKTLK